MCTFFLLNNERKEFLDFIKDHMNIHRNQPWGNQHRMDVVHNVELEPDILISIEEKNEGFCFFFLLLLTWSINLVTGIGLSKPYWWLIHSVRIKRLDTIITKKNDFIIDFSYQRIRASDANPAIETPIWSSINIIFFWWADNSDGAR